MTDYARWKPTLFLRDEPFPGGPSGSRSQSGIDTAPGGKLVCKESKPSPSSGAELGVITPIGGKLEVGDGQSPSGWSPGTLAPSGRKLAGRDGWPNSPCCAELGLLASHSGGPGIPVALYLLAR